MTEKEETIFNLIIKHIKENNTMPTMRFIQNKLGFKSINSITQYFKSLENKGYLGRNSNNEYVTTAAIFNNNLKRIKIINLKNKYIEIVLNKNKNYLGYKLNNNYFKKDFFIKNDILIIEENSKLLNGDFGLFIIDNKYRLMKYNYIEGFYVLNDIETLYLNHVKTVGKVIKIIRTI